MHTAFSPKFTPTLRRTDSLESLSSEPSTPRSLSRSDSFSSLSSRDSFSRSSSSSDLSSFGRHEDSFEPPPPSAKENWHAKKSKFKAHDQEKTNRNLAKRKGPAKPIETSASGPVRASLSAPPPSAKDFNFLGYHGSTDPVGLQTDGYKEEFGGSSQGKGKGMYVWAARPGKSEFANPQGLQQTMRPADGKRGAKDYGTVLEVYMPKDVAIQRLQPGARVPEPPAANTIYNIDCEVVIPPAVAARFEFRTPKT